MTGSNRRRLHVLMMTEDYPPGLLTGIGRHVEELAESLSEFGVKVCVVKVGSIAKSPPPKNFTILEAEPPVSLASLGWREGPCNLPLTLHGNLAMIERILGDHARYDLVHIHDIFAALGGFTVAAVLGLPTVFTKHFCLPGPQSLLQMVPAPGDSLKYFVKLEDWSLHAADQVIAVSDYVQRIILSRDDQLREKCAVVTNGTNISVAKPIYDRLESRERLAARLGIKGTLGTVLMQVSRLVYSKGADISLYALASLLSDAPASDSRLVLIGAGPPRYEQYLRRLALQLGVAHRVHFCGAEHSRTALAEMYTVADAILAPSRSESFSLVVAEAMSLRRLVIAASVGGNPEQVVHMHNGLVFRHGKNAMASGNAVAEIVRWTARNSLDAQRIARVGPLHGDEMYSWPRLADKVLSLYYDAIQRHRRTTGVRNASFACRQLT